MFDLDSRHFQWSIAVFDEEFENQKRGRNFAYKPIFVNEEPKIGDVRTVEITDATVHSLIGKIVR